MASPDVEKDGVHALNSRTASPDDIVHAPESTRKDVDIDNDARSITPASSGLQQAMEEKDQEDSIPSHRSAGAGTPIIVPRSKRRGLFGQLTFLAEVENPKTFPRNRKWFITFIVAVAGATAPMGSSIFFRK